MTPSREQRSGPATTAGPQNVAAAEQREPPAPPPSATLGATVIYAPNSANLSESGRSELTRVAGEINTRQLRYVELRSYAGGDDPIDARKVALARALSASSYLIDLRVKAQIRIGAWATSDRIASERVEIWLP